MKFFWFDHGTQGTDQTSPKNESLQVLVRETNASEAEVVRVPDGSITFVHSGGYFTEWRNAISACSGYVVFISSEQQTLTDCANRGYALTRGIEEFSKSGDLSAFVKSCRDGAPAWGLLKQPELPPHTVALLLVEIARRQMGDASIGAMSFDRLLRGAEKECGSALPTEPRERIERLRQVLGE